MSWPNNIPPDLRRKIEIVLSMRHCDSNEVWTELRAWLIKHNVEAPDLPDEPKAQTDWETMLKDGG